MATKMLGSSVRDDFQYFGQASRKLAKADRRELHRRKQASNTRDERRQKRQEEHWQTDERRWN
jgi:hypothetical protein